MSENPQQPEGGAAPELTEEEMAYVLSLFDMARAGDTENLLPALRAGVPVNLTNGKGDTLLILAAHHGHPDTVATLLAHGTDHGPVDDRGQTAPAAAVSRQSEPAVRARLQAGVDPDGGGPSARATAQFFDLPEMTWLLQGVSR